jgi:hypothetical protein
VAKFQIANQLNVTGSLSPDTLQSLGLLQVAVAHQVPSPEGIQ